MGWNEAEQLSEVTVEPKTVCCGIIHQADLQDLTHNAATIQTPEKEAAVCSSQREVALRSIASRLAQWDPADRYFADALDTMATKILVSGSWLLASNANKIHVTSRITV